MWTQIRLQRLPDVGPISSAVLFGQITSSYIPRSDKIRRRRLERCLTRVHASHRRYHLHRLRRRTLAPLPPPQTTSRVVVVSTRWAGDATVAIGMLALAETDWQGHMRYLYTHIHTQFAQEQLGSSCSLLLLLLLALFHRLALRR